MTLLDELREEYDLDTIPILVPDHRSHERPPIQILLHRPRRKTNGTPVLLLHGASAGSDTFLTPRRKVGRSLCLFDALLGAGCEPWLLDWRGSKFVTDAILQCSAEGAPPASDLFDFNLAAEHDIAEALEVIAREREEEGKSKKSEPLRIDAIGYCMGGAILAEALLKNNSRIRKRLSRVVLMTIGLFYQMNVHGRLKAEAHLLKRVISDEPERRVLDPRIDKDSGELLPAPAWPESVETLYQVWRHPYDEARMDRESVPKNERYVLEMFNRVSFMFGEPYNESNLVPEIHHRLVYVPLSAEDGVGSLSVGTRIEARDGNRVVARGELAYRYGSDDTQSVQKSSDVDIPPKLVLYRCHGTEKQEQAVTEQEGAPKGQKTPMFWNGLSLWADGQSIGKVEGQTEHQEPLLPDLFGAIPLHLFMHGAENLRAGVATDLYGNGEDRQGSTPTPVLDRFQDDPAEAYEGFAELDHLALIGGGLNRLWHRDSVDRMGAWLARDPRMRKSWSKYILIDYGHQDLLWGREAAKDVFPVILEGLGKKKNAGKDKQPSRHERESQAV